MAEIVCAGKNGKNGNQEKYTHKTYETFIDSSIERRSDFTRAQKNCREYGVPWGQLQNCEELFCSPVRQNQFFHCVNAKIESSPFNYVSTKLKLAYFWKQVGVAIIVLVFLISLSSAGMDSEEIRK